MATIQDHSNFKIVIKPEYSNWWSFYLEFYFKDKPVFNPEILREEGIKADEWENNALLPVFEKAVESKTDGETFGWGAWEEEAEIEIEAVMKNLDKGMDGAFNFTAFVSENAFKDGEMNYMFQNAGVRLFVNREELKKFYNDLKKEMSDVAKRVVEELSHKKDKGYDDHIKFLKPYIQP